MVSFWHYTSIIHHTYSIRFAKMGNIKHRQTRSHFSIFVINAKDEHGIVHESKIIDGRNSVFDSNDDSERVEDKKKFLLFLFFFSFFLFKLNASGQVVLYALFLKLNLAFRANAHEQQIWNKKIAKRTTEKRKKRTKKKEDWFSCDGWLALTLFTQFIMIWLLIFNTNEKKK